MARGDPAPDLVAVALELLPLADPEDDADERPDADEEGTKTELGEQSEPEPEAVVSPVEVRVLSPPLTPPAPAPGELPLRLVSFVEECGGGIDSLGAPAAVRGGRV